jgi:acyl carrier protein
MSLQTNTSLTEPQVSGDPNLVQAIQSLCLEKMSIRIDAADADLFAVGALDSMTLVQLILHLEEHFGLTLPMEELETESFRSLDAIAQLVAARTAATNE